jgi:hypothetical protein
MPSFNPGIPQSGEYNPAFAGYVGKAQSFADPVQKLDEQRRELLSLLRPLSGEQQLHRYAPEKWSVKQVLGHLIDTERVFAYRALRVARGDQTPLPSFEHDDYVAASEVESSDWVELLEEFDHVRQASTLLLRHLPETAWRRSGTASGAPVTVRALAYIMIGRVEHHLEILRQRYL